MICVFFVCFMYILYVYVPSAWNKIDDDDDVSPKNYNLCLSILLSLPNESQHITLYNNDVEDDDYECNVSAVLFQGCCGELLNYYATLTRYREAARKAMSTRSRLSYTSCMHGVGRGETQRWRQKVPSRHHHITRPLFLGYCSAAATVIMLHR